VLLLATLVMPLLAKGASEGFPLQARLIFASAAGWIKPPS
jgi:hypothetical protein